MEIPRNHSYKVEYLERDERTRANHPRFPDGTSVRRSAFRSYVAAAHEAEASRSGLTAIDVLHAQALGESTFPVTNRYDSRLDDFRTSIQEKTLRYFDEELHCFNDEHLPEIRTILATLEAVGDRFNVLAVKHLQLLDANYGRGSLEEINATKEDYLEYVRYALSTGLGAWTTSPIDTIREKQLPLDATLRELVLVAADTAAAKYLAKARDARDHRDVKRIVDAYELVGETQKAASFLSA